MNIIDFFNKYDGKVIDVDGVYDGQCMDLYNKYQEEIMRVKAKGAPYAYQVWDTYDRNNFEKIPNTIDFIPKLGDVAVWSKGELPYGHVSICTGKGDINNFESFDQNFPIGSKCHFQNHNYFNGFLGVLRPKVGNISVNKDFLLRVDKKEAAVNKGNYVWSGGITKI